MNRSDAYKALGPLEMSTMSCARSLRSLAREALRLPCSRHPGAFWAATLRNPSVWYSVPLRRAHFLKPLPV